MTESPANETASPEPEPGDPERPVRHATVAGAETGYGFPEVDPGTDTGFAAGAELAALADLPPGQDSKLRVGLYEIAGELGEGGMGKVYKAYHPIDRRYVAMKVIAPGHAEEHRHLRDLFLREAAVLKSIDHPNVVRCYEVNEGLLAGRPILYMAMELLQGESLDRRLRRAPLSIDEVIRIAKDVARALAALHGHETKILHRDLKPHNIFLTAAGAKLLDFGLAALADWRMTRFSEFASGSRPYMSPEQFKGLRHCTERSDLYSFGVTLFEMAAGRAPFECESEIAYFVHHTERTPPTIVEARPALLEGPDRKKVASLQNIVTKLLAKNANERYADANAVLRALEFTETGGAITRPRVTRPERRRFVRRVLGVAALLLVLAGAVGGTMLFTRWQGPRKLVEARAAIEAFDYDTADLRTNEALVLDPKNPAALDLQRAIAELLRRRRDYVSETAAGARLVSEKRLADAAASYRSALEHAVRPPRIASDDELARLRRTVAAVEEDRRSALEAVLAGVRADVAAARSGSFDGGALLALAASDEDRAKASAATALLAASAAVFAAAGEIDAGRLEEARARLDGLERAGMPAELAERATATRTLLAAAIELRDLERGVEVAARDELWEETIRKGGLLLGRLRGAGAPAVLAKDAGRIEALVARARFEDALGRGQSAELGRRLDAAKELYAAAAVHAADVPAERRRALEAATARVRATIFQESVAAARPLARTSARQAAAFAQRALANAPLAEVPLLARMARDLPAAVSSAGAPSARAWLRASMDAVPVARSALLLLEEAAAAEACPDGFVLVPRRERIVLGSRLSDKENDEHEATLAPFYIAVLEATNADYARFVAAGGYANGALFDPADWERRGELRPVGEKGVLGPLSWKNGRLPPGTDALPVRGIGFSEALAFARWRKARLPSADEWEVAASVRPDGRRLQYPWGDDFDERVARRGAAEPLRGGAAPADRSPWGCLDMGGNVQEWTFDARAPGKVRRVLKGGSFQSRDAGEFCCDRRLLPEENGRYDDSGARLAMDPPLPDISFLARGE